MIRISRRAVLALLPVAVTLRVRDVLAQRAAGPARIGWLSYLAPPDPGVETLREGLRELGYVEGKSFVVVPRFADGDFTRLPRPDGPGGAIVDSRPGRPHHRLARRHTGDVHERA